MKRDELLKPGTFTSVPLAILKQKALTPTDKCVYAAMLNYLGANPTEWAGQTALAKASGCSIRAVSDAQEQLVALGLITYHGIHPKNNSKIYSFNDPESVNTDSAPVRRRRRNKSNTDSVPMGGSVPALTTYQEGDDSVPGGYCQRTSRNTDSVPSEPTKHPTKETTKGTNSRSPAAKTESEASGSISLAGKVKRSKGIWPAENVEQIYLAYPRKVGRGAALTSIRKALTIIKESGEHADPAAYLLGRTKLFAASDAGNRGKYTPHPTTWFNQLRFQDDAQEWDPKGHDRTGNIPRILADEDVEEICATEGMSNEDLLKL